MSIPSWIWKTSLYIAGLSLVYWLIIIPMLKGLDRFSPSESLGQIVGTFILILPIILAINGWYWIDTLFNRSSAWYSSDHWQRRKTPYCQECLDAGDKPDIRCKTVLIEKWGPSGAGYFRRAIYIRDFTCTNGHSWKRRD